MAISTFFLVRSPRYARNDNFSYEIATLPTVARNDFVTTLIAFILINSAIKYCVPRIGEKGKLYA